MHHPIQPIVKDDNGVLRFKSNAIVEYLLHHGTTDLNDLARLDFPKEDRQQFSQLIGYSLSGYGELSYVDDETYMTAEAMAEQEITETQARIEYLEKELADLRAALRGPMARLFGVHPDDLGQQG